MRTFCTCVHLELKSRKTHISKCHFEKVLFVVRLRGRELHKLIPSRSFRAQISAPMGNYFSNVKIELGTYSKGRMTVRAQSITEDLIIQKKRAIHVWHANRFINPTWALFSLEKKQVNPQWIVSPHGVYKPVRGPRVNRPLLLDDEARPRCRMMTVFWDPAEVELTEFFLGD